ncbi:hypothetical protein D3C87_407230 [compost metagenome]
MTYRNGLKVVVILILLVGIGVPVYFIIKKQKMLNLIVPDLKEITLIRADIHQDTAHIAVNAVVQNKAPYDMKIDSIICELALGGTKLVSTSQYVGLSQKSGESDTVTITVAIPISPTRNKIKSLQKQDSTGIAFFVSIVYSNRKLSFIRGQQIEVPVPPKIRLLKTENLEVKLFKKKVKADLFLEIINDGKNLSLDIHDIQYELSIGNDFSTKGKFPKKDVSLRPESSLILKFPLDVKLKQPGKTIWKILSDKDRLPFKVKISGYLDVGKMKRIPVVIFASGKIEILNQEKNKAKKQSKRERKKEKRKEKREDRKELRQERREERKEKREEKKTANT